MELSGRAKDAIVFLWSQVERWKAIGRRDTWNATEEEVERLTRYHGMWDDPPGGYSRERLLDWFRGYLHAEETPYGNAGETLQFALTHIDSETRPKDQDMSGAGLKRFIRDYGLSNGPQMSLIQPQPFIDVARNNVLPTDVNDPSNTVTTGRNHSLIEPPAFLVQNGHFEEGRDRTAPIDQPAPTQTTWRGNAIATMPFLTAYHGGRDAAQPITDPSWTIATNNQFGVVEPQPTPLGRAVIESLAS